MRVSQPGGLRAPIITIFGTQVLGLGMTVFVNVKENAVFLLCSRQQNIKILPIGKENNATVAIPNITRSHLCLRVRGDILTSPEKEHWLKHTRLVNATVENASKELLFLDISTAINA